MASDAAEANQPSRPLINCNIACGEQTISLQWILMTIYCERRNERVKRAVEQAMGREHNELQCPQELPPDERQERQDEEESETGEQRAAGIYWTAA